MDVQLVRWLLVIGVLGCGSPGKEPQDPSCVDADDDGVCVDEDCDDSDALTSPGAAEQPGDGIDQDCDGGEVCYVDGDGDGWRTEVTLASIDPGCQAAGEALATAPGGDCDDADPAANPDGLEVVGDGVDQDCDGLDLCHVDADQDGSRADELVAAADCAAPGFAVASAEVDCDDADAALATLTAFSIATDYDPLNNSDLGSWSYRHTDSFDAAAPLVLLPLSGVVHHEDLWYPGPQPWLWSVGDNVVPWLGRNDTGVTQAIADTAWPVGAFAMHPPDVGTVAVSWRAPHDGEADLLVQLGDIAPTWEGVAWALRSGNVLLASGAIDGSDPLTATSGPVAVADLAVVAGDRIDLVVDPRGMGPNACPFGASCSDTTRVEFLVDLCGP